MTQGTELRAEVKHGNKTFVLTVRPRVSSGYVGQVWDMDKQIYAMGAEDDTLEGTRQGTENALHAYLGQLNMDRPDLKVDWDC
jgi:hypothetical protein